MPRHTIANTATEVFHCATDLTAALVNDSYSFFQVVANPRWQQRQVSRAKLAVETLVTFAVAVWSVYVNWADRFVSSRLDSEHGDNEPESAATLTQMSATIAQVLVTDIFNGLLPGIGTALAHDIQLDSTGVVTVHIDRVASSTLHELVTKTA